MGDGLGRGLVVIESKGGLMSKMIGAIAGVAALLAATEAGATTFVFKGDGNNANPGNSAGPSMGANSEACATPGALGDLCTIVGADGFTYSMDGVEFTATAYAGGTSGATAGSAFALGTATTLIQDRSPLDSGLGAWSERDVDFSADQTQAASGESIVFDFSTMDNPVTVTNVEFNQGGDTNCSTANGPEGGCGSVRVQIEDAMGMIIADTVYNLENPTPIDVLAVLGTGVRFILTAIGSGQSGFTIAQFTVTEVPVPAALPLLLSGIAGLGFASRRRKRA